MTIRELRTLKGWTQKDLADNAGVSVEVIVRMERNKGSGYASVGFGNCKKVADALGITLDGLWDIVSSESDTPKQGNNTLRWTKTKRRVR